MTLLLVLTVGGIAVMVLKGVLEAEAPKTSEHETFLAAVEAADKVSVRVAADDLKRDQRRDDLDLSAEKYAAEWDRHARERVFDLHERAAQDKQRQAERQAERQADIAHRDAQRQADLDLKAQQRLEEEDLRRFLGLRLTVEYTVMGDVPIFRVDQKGLVVLDPDDGVVVERYDKVRETYSHRGQVLAVGGKYLELQLVNPANKRVLMDATVLIPLADITSYSRR